MAFNAESKYQNETTAFLTEERAIVKQIAGKELDRIGAQGALARAEVVLKLQGNKDRRAWAEESKVGA